MRCLVLKNNLAKLVVGDGSVVEQLLKMSSVSLCIAEGGLCGAHSCLRLADAALYVGWIEPHQHLPAPHPVAFLNGDVANISGQPGSDIHALIGDHGSDRGVLDRRAKCHLRDGQVPDLRCRLHRGGLVLVAGGQ
jgi:hypothetical protein